VGLGASKIFASSPVGLRARAFRDNAIGALPMQRSRRFGIGSAPDGRAYGVVVPVHFRTREARWERRVFLGAGADAWPASRFRAFPPGLESR